MFEYKFKIIDYRVIDGDTVDCTLDLGFAVYTRERVRLHGIDAPETRTKNLEEKERGFIAKRWLESRMDQGELLELVSEEFNRGKFGRVIGTIVVDGVNVNLLMLSEGLVEPYPTP